MVLGHKTPIARIGAAIPVVAHHPVIVHLESVILGLLAVDIELAVAFLKSIALVGAYGTLVDRVIVLRKFQGSTAFGNS